MSTLQSAQHFFFNRKPFHPEELLMQLDLLHTMALIKFGDRMIEEANQEMTRRIKTGETLDANAIRKDIEVVWDNLISLKGAYQLMMN